jgi:hypothetical protein
VGHDRFDDVEFRIVEGARPPRRPRRPGRWAIALLAGVLVAGAAAGGASALSGDEPANEAVAPAKERGWTEYAPLSRDRDGDRPCRRDERKHQRESSSVRY